MIITKEEAIEYLKKLKNLKEDIDVIFAYHKDHPIELIKNIPDGYPGGDDGKEIRWVQTIKYSEQLGNGPNQMSIKYREGEITQEEHMNYNRQIGYSLYGFWEMYCYNYNFDEKQYILDMREQGFEQLDRND